MTNNLPEKIKAILDSLNIQTEGKLKKKEKQAIIPPKILTESYLVSGINDSLAPEIQELIHRLMDWGSVDYTKFSDYFDLHAKIVMFFENIGLKEFSMQEIIKYEQSYNKSLNTSLALSEKQNLDSFYQKKDEKYNPERYLAAYNFWRGIEFIKTTKDLKLKLKK